MSTQQPLLPSSEPPPAAALFPLPDATPPAPPTAAASDAPAGGARKLSRWEEREEFWFPEPTDFSHSGINE